MSLRISFRPLKAPLRMSHQSLRTPIRTLATTPSLRLKETGNRSPEELEAKKQEQLEKQKRGEGHWHSELGSRSEEHVKADREDIGDHGEHIRELQQEGKRKGETGEMGGGH
jgi:hypothetical protein